MGDWQPIETAPEGNDHDGPFFDVIWAGETHQYLPVPRRFMNCYKERGAIRAIHGYPAVWTLFRPQPTHWLALPDAPACTTPQTKETGEP